MNSKEKRKFNKAGGEELVCGFDNLDSNSIVLDIGMYHGAWSKLMAEKYDPFILGLEPVKAFCDKAEKVLKDYPKVSVFNYGLGGQDRNIDINVDSNATSMSNAGDEPVSIRCIGDVLEELYISNVNLACINIEGGEYELLNYILSRGMITMFDMLLIQFHETESIQERRQIRSILGMTHSPVFIFDTVWELWKGKNSENTKSDNLYSSV